MSKVLYKVKENFEEAKERLGINLFTQLYTNETPKIFDVIDEEGDEILDWRIGHTQFITKFPDETASSYKINSIKRLSDGVIFSVGDRIMVKTNKKNNSIRYLMNKQLTIYSIEINEGNLNGYNSAEDKEDIFFSTTICGDWVPLLDSTKIIPLFKSTDNQNVYEGDIIWGINLEWKIFSIKINEFNAKEDWRFGKYCYEQNAKEFVIKNKPCLSLKILNDLNIKLNDEDIVKLREYMFRKNKF